MPKTISAAMQTHLDGEVTSLTTCWALKRTDETVILFTEHDQDIDLSGESTFVGRFAFLAGTYLAVSGSKRTAITSGETEIDNLEIEAILGEAGVTAAAINGGKYDGAQLFVFQVNWDDLSDGIIKLPGSGTIGEITVNVRAGTYKVELRGLGQYLTHRMGDIYGPGCRVDLFSFKCKLDESTFIQHSVVSSVDNNREFRAVLTAAVFDDQVLTVTNHSFESGVQIAPAITGWTEEAVQATGMWQTVASAPDAKMLDTDQILSFEEDYTASGKDTILRREALKTPQAHTVQFAQVPPGTMTRTQGSWIDDGFVENMIIFVDGTASNDGTYLVASGGVTTLVLTLDSGETLTPEAAVECAVSSVPDNGLWTDDGFEQSIVITVSGSASNDGDYTVGAVFRDVFRQELSLIGNPLTAEAARVGVTVVGISPSADANALHSDLQTPHDLDATFSIFSDVISISAGGGSEPSTAELDGGQVLVDITVAIRSTQEDTDIAQIGVIMEDGGGVEVGRTLSAEIRTGQHGLEQILYVDFTRTFMLVEGTRQIRVLLRTEKKGKAGGTVCGIRWDNVRATIRSNSALDLGLDRDSVILPGYFNNGVIKWLTGSNEGRGTEIDTYRDAEAYMVPLTPVALNDTNPDTIIRSSGSWITDGFVDTMVITIVGSASNDGTYTIDGDPTATTITLIGGDSLVDESSQTDLIITGGDTNLFKMFLKLPFTPVVGDQFLIFPGCQKRHPEDCTTKWDNGVNFRAEPYVPGEDQIKQIVDSKGSSPAAKRAAQKQLLEQN